jgi:hypothetical protein
MTVGLPGAGISVFFYLIAILVMPVRALWVVARGGALPAGSLGLVARQWTIAMGIVVVIWMTGLALGLAAGDVVVTADAGTVTEAPADGAGTIAAPADGVVTIAAEPLESALARVGIWITLATLPIILVIIQVLSLVTARRPAKRRSGSRTRLADSGDRSFWQRPAPPHRSMAPMHSSRSTVVARLSDRGGWPTGSRDEGHASKVAVSPAASE